MKAIYSGVLTLVFSWSSAAAMAQQTVFDPGKREFSDNCASCHGVDGKGNGAIVEFLRKSPPDLTLLAKNNQGVLPINRLYTVIDGVGVASHGTRDMPVWGREYRIEAGQQMREARGQYDASELVRARILLLLEYISRIQAP